MVTIKAGIIGEAALIVGKTHPAKNLGSDGVEVLTTPAMIALMEDAAPGEFKARLS